MHEEVIDSSLFSRIQRWLGGTYQSTRNPTQEEGRGNPTESQSHANIIQVSGLKMTSSGMP
jgi:hypothetical protein